MFCVLTKIRTNKRMPYVPFMLCQRVSAGFCANRKHSESTNWVVKKEKVSLFTVRNRRIWKGVTLSLYIKTVKEMSGYWLIKEYPSSVKRILNRIYRSRALKKIMVRYIWYPMIINWWYIIPRHSNYSSMKHLSPLLIPLIPCRISAKIVLGFVQMKVYISFLPEKADTDLSILVLQPNLLPKYYPYSKIITENYGCLAIPRE